MKMKALPMVDHFQRSRWSSTRERIHAMLPGTQLELPQDQYYNANATVRRFNDAYDGTRTYQVRTRGGHLVVKRIL